MEKLIINLNEKERNEINSALNEVDRTLVLYGRKYGREGIERAFNQTENLIECVTNYLMLLTGKGHVSSEVTYIPSYIEDGGWQKPRMLRFKFYDYSNRENRGLFLINNDGVYFVGWRV